MLGGSGLTASSKAALLNANYIAVRLSGHYSVRFVNGRGRVAHELLLDLGEFERSAGLRVADFAKRLQDYGFHPPTCSWPISTAMLIEPTESESLAEIDRFCEAMIEIRKEAQEIVDGRQPRDNNLLKNAPHPVNVMLVPEEKWERPYSRERAAYPLAWLREKKFWPSVARVDDGTCNSYSLLSCCLLIRSLPAYGDLNLICDCPSVEEVASS